MQHERKCGAGDRLPNTPIFEEVAAREGSPVLACDTDALATRVWERRYVGRRSHHTVLQALGAPE